MLQNIRLNLQVKFNSRYLDENLNVKLKTNKMKTSEKINRIKEYLDSDLVNDNFKELLYQLTQINMSTNKHDLLKLAGYTDDQVRKIDSAYPMALRESFENVGCNPIYFSYDYNENNFGSPINCAEKFGV